ncbi:MAG: regulator, partial [Flavobacteriaceae bacterium]|nr:regulator [Flavobacteriaceae bacterium]
MKKYIHLFVLLLAVYSCEKSDVPGDSLVVDPNPDPITEVAFPCENGLADVYPCNDYDLVSYISLDDLDVSGVSGNDSWGWTDSTTGKEYALMCTSSGTSFIDITNAIAPVILGRLP